jgi:predicted CoA-binding protein
MIDDATLHTILSTCRTLAVVGLSPHADRPSHGVARYMQSHGYRIVPVNPLVAREGGRILGEPCHASLPDAARALAAEGLRIDLVDCFRKSEDIPPLAEDAIGVSHAQAAARAQAAGLWVVQDRCIKIEHARWVASHAPQAEALRQSGA